MGICMAKLEIDIEVDDLSSGCPFLNVFVANNLDPDQTTLLVAI